MLLRSLSDCQSLTLKLQVNYPQQHLKGRLGPGVRHVTLFAPKEVGWDPVFVTWCLLPQRRLVGAPCWWRHVFFIKGGQWTTSRFLTKEVLLSLSVDGTCCRNPKMMLQKILKCCFKYLWIVWFKFSSAFAIDVSGFAHSCHGVLNLDHRAQCV